MGSINSVARPIWNETFTDYDQYPAESDNTASVFPSTNYASTESAQQDSLPHDPDHPPYSPSPQSPIDISALCDWPSEISNAMEWSVRFFDYPHFQPS